jgi:uncharacterized protein (TIGR02266 family)
LDYPPSDRRTNLRGTILVTQVKMGDERRYFFGYAKNISRSGIYIQTVSPKNVGDKFNIEFIVPKTDIFVKCICEVVWSRPYSKSGNVEPGMGLNFVELDPSVADRIEDWVRNQAGTED